MTRDVKPGGGANQDQKEKKDHEQHPGGRSERSDFEDPQANQSKGRRKGEAATASGRGQAHDKPESDTGPTNNTTSGGNRPKVPQRTDHN